MGALVFNSCGAIENQQKKTLAMGAVHVRNSLQAPAGPAMAAAS